MRIEVKKLLARKKYEGDFAFDYTPAQDELLLPLCRIEGAVRAEGDYAIGDDGAVSVSIRLSYTLAGQCSYCLENTVKRVDYATEVLFVRDKDPDNYFYDGVNVDLTAAVKDAFIISQPDVLLCKEGCEGIKI